MLNIKKGGHRDLERYFTLIEMDFDSDELLPKIGPPSQVYTPSTRLEVLQR